MEINRDMIKEFCVKENIAGASIALIEDREVKQMEIVSKNPEKQIITKDSIFQMGSISKLVTSWAICLLYKNKEINIQDPVNKYLSEWKLESNQYNADQVTIEMILSHFAGLNQRSYLGVSSVKKLESTLDYLKRRKVKVVNEPDVKPIYSGGGYTVLQLLVEEVTGMSFADFTRQNILIPLQMRQSTFDHSKVDQSKLLSCYGILGQRSKCYLYSQQAAAGLYSTIQDMSTFALANMNPDNVVIGELLNRVQKRYKRTYPNCLGCDSFIANSKKLVESKGINRGWFSCMIMLPAQGSGIVFISNSNRGKKLFSTLSKKWMESHEFFLSDEYIKFI